MAVVTVVDDVGNSDGGCADDDSSDVMGGGDFSGLVEVVWGVFWVETVVVVVMGVIWVLTGSVWTKWLVVARKTAATSRGLVWVLVVVVEAVQIDLCCV